MKLKRKKYISINGNYHEKNNKLLLLINPPNAPLEYKTNPIISSQYTLSSRIKLVY